MKSLKPSEKILVGAVLALAFYAYTFLFVIRQNKDLKRLTDQITQSQAQLVANKSLVAAIKSRKIASSEKASGLDQKQVFNENSRAALFLERLNEVAKKQKLQIVRLVVDKSSEEGGVSKNEMKLEIESDFLGIGKMLEALETSALLTEVGSIEILRMNPDLKKCLTRISLTQYVFKGEL